MDHLLLCHPPKKARINDFDTSAVSSFCYVVNQLSQRKFIKLDAPSRGTRSTGILPVASNAIAIPKKSSNQPPHSVHNPRAHQSNFVQRRRLRAEGEALHSPREKSKYGEAVCRYLLHQRSRNIMKHTSKIKYIVNRLVIMFFSLSLTSIAEETEIKYEGNLDDLLKISDDIYIAYYHRTETDLVRFDRKSKIKNDKIYIEIGKDHNPDSLGLVINEYDVASIRKNKKEEWVIPYVTTFKVDLSNFDSSGLNQRLTIRATSSLSPFIYVINPGEKYKYYIGHDAGNIEINCSLLADDDSKLMQLARITLLKSEVSIKLEGDLKTGLNIVTSYGGIFVDND